MARAIVVARGSADGPQSRFGFQLIDRDKLYGRRKRVVVDDRGEPCVAGHLSIDGSVLLLGESRALLYLDEQGDVVDRAALVSVGEDGQPLTRLESTLDVAQPLYGPIPAERVLDHDVTSVYELSAEAGDGAADAPPGEAATIDKELVESLRRGEIWETVFNYMPGYERQTLFLVGGPEGLFALVARPASIAWIDRQSPPPEPIDDGGGDDELDFSMF